MALVIQGNEHFIRSDGIINHFVNGYMRENRFNQLKRSSISQHAWMTIVISLTFRRGVKMRE